MHFSKYFSGHKGIKKIMLILQGEGGERACQISIKS